MLDQLPSSKKTYDSIQILRGVAALLVVVFHLALSYDRRNHWQMADGFFMSGYAGVDLFFVISGFVIMHTSHRYFGVPQYFGTYVRKRLIRIYPIYWITLAVILLGLTLLPFAGKGLTEILPSSWLSVVSSLLLWPGHPMINGVTWSLSYELYYYLLFGLLIMSWRLWPVPVIVLILSGVSALNGLQTMPDFSLVNFLFSPFNLEFALGVAAWWLIHRYKFTPVFCYLLIAIAGGWLLVHDKILFEDQSKRLFFYGISSFLLVTAATGLEQNGWFKPSLVQKQLIKLGNASFLLYIIHFPILTTYSSLISPFLHTSVDYILATLLLVVALSVISVYLHYQFEAPLLKKLTALFIPVRHAPKPNQV